MVVLQQRFEATVYISCYVSRLSLNNMIWISGSVAMAGSSVSHTSPPVVRVEVYLRRYFCTHGPLTRYVNCGLRTRWEWQERFPRHQLQRKPLVNDPGMRHGTWVTHVPWCMSGSLTPGGGENVPGIPDACATRNFYVSWKKPILEKYYIWVEPVIWCSVELYTGRGPYRYIRDAIWRYWSVSSLVQAMACCLNQCWLIINSALWHSPVSHSTRNALELISNICQKNALFYYYKIS